MKERRYKILAVNPEFLVEFFSGNPITLVSAPLPADVKMVGLGKPKDSWMFDTETCSILLILESSEWDIVPVGQTIQYLDPATFKYA